jgi:hypothetical protein
VRKTQEERGMNYIGFFKILLCLENRVLCNGYINTQEREKREKTTQSFYTGSSYK